MNPKTAHLFLPSDVDSAIPLIREITLGALRREDKEDDKRNDASEGSKRRGKCEEVGVTCYRGRVV
jgi:hypothetical protein